MRSVLLLVYILTDYLWRVIFKNIEKFYLLTQKRADNFLLLRYYKVNKISSVFHSKCRYTTMRISFVFQKKTISWAIVHVVFFLLVASFTIIASRFSYLFRILTKVFMFSILELIGHFTSLYTYIHTVPTKSFATPTIFKKNGN